MQTHDTSPLPVRVLVGPEVASFEVALNDAVDLVRRRAERPRPGQATRPLDDGEAADRPAIRAALIGAYVDLLREGDEPIVFDDDRGQTWVVDRSAISGIVIGGGSRSMEHRLGFVLAEPDASI